METGLKQWRTYRWCALATALLAIVIAYRLIETVSSNSIADGAVRPAIATVVVPASWALLEFGGCALAYVLVRWNGSRQQRILVELLHRIDGIELPQGEAGRQKADP